MRRLFSKKTLQDSSIPSLEDASSSVTSRQIDSRSQDITLKIQDCDRHLDNIKLQIQRATGISLKLAKQKALTILKRRKMYSNQLDALMAQRYAVDYIALQQTSIHDSLGLFKALLQARAIQKQQLSKIQPDNVEDLMLDLQDNTEDIQEINKIMNRDYGLNDFDETQLEDELAELDVELNQESLSSNSLQVPSYLPTTELESVVQSKHVIL